MDIFAQDQVKRLVRALLVCGSEKECADFLRDLMTTRELLDLSQRLEIARRLEKGESCAQISASGEGSPATVSRVNHSRRYGTGGYRAILGKLTEKEG